MSQYQSIYRKWRPQFFEDIIGQEHITRTLKNAIRLNRLAHAYIFSGPRGVGKTTTARILAKAMNCQEGPTEHPCNKCNQCQRINRGQSMDVVEIDGASNRGIDEIRELRSKIGFAPAEGKYKVYIIDEVHMLTNEAFNALLKTLEEPPSQVLFVFATTAPQKIPKTILSRCQCFHFRRISIDEIVNKLQKITEEDRLDIDHPSLYLIAEGATGSMRDAESILDQIITFSEKKVTCEEVKEILGIIPQKHFLQLIQAIMTQDTKEGLDLIDQLVKEGIDLHQFVQDMIVFTHRLSVIKITGKSNQKLTLPEKDDTEQLANLAYAIDLKTMLSMIEELNQIEEKIKNHPYPWILLELLIVKVTCGEKQSRKSKDPGKTSLKKEEPGNQVDKFEVGVEKTAEENRPEVQRHSGRIDQQKYHFEEWWPKVLSRIKNEKISLYAFLVANSRVYMEDDQLMIFFHQDCLFHKESLEKRENRELVEAIVKNESKFEIKMNCIIDQGLSKERSNFNSKSNHGKIKPNQSKHEDSSNQQKQTERKKQDSLSVNDILEEARDLFGGDIIEE